MFGIPLHHLSVWYEIQSQPSTWVGWEGSSRKGLPVDGVENSSRRGATIELNLTCTMLGYDIWASVSYFVLICSKIFPMPLIYFKMLHIPLICSEMFHLSLIWSGTFYTLLVCSNYSVLHLQWTDMFRNVLSAIDMLRNISYAIDMLQLLYSPFVMNQICYEWNDICDFVSNEMISLNLLDSVLQCDILFNWNCPFSC